MSNTAEEQWTIQKLLEWTTDFFSKSATGNARLEAEVLLAEALDCDRIHLYTRFAEIPEAEPLANFRAWVKRRGAGEPVAYIVGHREFYSLRFSVDSNVLIPRAETEHVVVAALEAAKELRGVNAPADKPLRIIDIGTGSGCIAVTLATQIENCKIAAIDVSEGALTVAKQNAESHEVSDSIKFFQGDLLDALPSGSNPVDMIVSNPPYIGESEINTIDDQVKKHEPSIALFGGEKGTEIIERLVEQAPNFLLPGGFLIFETSPIVMDLCVKLVKANPAFASVEVVKDFGDLQRVVVARMAN
ncbi:MAG: peptide chain release factor N(5)-glutamine methyltransferase [Mariniblastus sp.]